MSSRRMAGANRPVRPWAAFGVVVGGYFMAQLDMTVLTVALPRIRQDLGASVVEGTWAVGAYVLTLAAGLITAGRLGDLFGNRRVFAWGVALFTIFSLVCGLAQSPAGLIAARACQGAGAALLVPQILATIVTVMPKRLQGTALGIRGSVGAGAAVVGPLIGGLLVTALDWRWIFFVNVPIGAALFAAALAFLPAEDQRRSRRLDVTGAGLAALALLIGVYTLMQAGEIGWTAASWLGAGLTALAAGVFAIQQRRAQGADPLLPFAIFASRRYVVMLPAGVSVSAVVIGFTLVLSFFLQDGLGASAAQTGLVIAPASLTSMLLAPAVGRLIDRRDARRVLAAGLLVTALALAASAWLMTPGRQWGSFIPVMCFIGAGNAMLITPLTAIAMRDVPRAVAGAASGVLATVLQCGSVLGTALVTVAMQVQARSETFVEASRDAMIVPLAGVALAAVSCAFVGRVPARGE